MPPKVSCILPTGYGDKFVWSALQCFLDQTYTGELELVVVDNNDVPIQNLLPLDPRIKYVRSKRMPVGALRNLGTEHATAEICVTWDEDDWSHPDRITQQVQRLLESGKAVTGWHSILYWDADTQEGYRYVYSPGRPHEPYACGTSQCYRKSWWEKHKFVEVGVEDHPFSSEALHLGELGSCDAGQLCVARVHGQNVCPKKAVLGKHKQFQAVERSQFPQQFFDTINVSM